MRDSSSCLNIRHINKRVVIKHLGLHGGTGGTSPSPKATFPLRATNRIRQENNMNTEMIHALICLSALHLI